MAGGGGSGGNSTTRVEPPKYQLPYLQRGLGYAQGLYDKPGSTIAPFSPETESALSGTAARAQGGSPITSAAQGLATNTLNGGFLGSNPYLDQTFNRAALQTQNQLASQFAGSGRNVGASEDLRSGQLNDLATGIYGGAYDAERNRQMQTLGMANSLANQDYTDLGQLLAAGGQRDQLRHDQLDEPGRNLDSYLARVSGNMGTTQINPSSRNRLSGAIGGGMLGSQLGGQLTNGNGYGQLFGGLLGAYGGGWG